MSLTLDIAGLTKPKSSASVVKSAGAYLAHMRSTGKRIDHIAIHAADYDAILRAANTGRAKDAEKFSELRLSGVVVQRSA